MAISSLPDEPSGLVLRTRGRYGRKYERSSLLLCAVWNRASRGRCPLVSFWDVIRRRALARGSRFRRRIAPVPSGPVEKGVGALTGDAKLKAEGKVDDAVGSRVALDAA